MFFWSRSLLLRTMALFSLITFVFLAAVFGIFFTVSVNELTSQALQNSIQNLGLLNSNLDMVFDRLTGFMNALTINGGFFFEDRQTVLDYFNQYRNLYPDQSVVMVIEDDDVIAISNQQLLYSLTVDTGHMHSLSRTNRMVITGSYYSPLLASRVVSVIRSLTDPASGREVLVVCEVSVNSIFSGFIRKMEPYETLIVLDANDETVYMNAATLPCLQASSQSALLDISDELRGALSALGEGSHELSLSSGARIMQILRGGQGWNLCVLMDANQFYRDVRSVQNIYLLIGALALFALTGVSMLLSRWVLQPVRMLAAQMDGISTSEQAVLSAVTRKDEIGKLQQSFQRLLVRLQLAGAERIRMERRRYELEYKVLQSQIQPHFLFNIHICVDSLLEQNRIDEARRMLGAMDALLRISIDKKEMVSLEEEIGITHMYVTLQQTRLHEAFDFIAEGWEPFRAVPIPKLLIQPIIENAIYHGLANISRRGNIRLSVMEIDERLHIVVEDNGQGISEERLEMIRSGAVGSLAGQQGLVSIGLYNVSQRIRSYYGENCGLYVSSRIDIGTRVELVIDKQTCVPVDSAC